MKHKHASLRMALAVGTLLPVLAVPMVTSAYAASTTETAVAVHGLYLRSTAQLNNWNQIAYLPSQSQMTVLSASASWLKVELASGKIGFVLDKPYYVSTTQTTTPVPHKSGTNSTPLQTEATVLHAAYLKSSTHLGTSNELQLVPAGTIMTVLAQTTYWLHVQLPDGQTGYITADHYYTSTPAQQASTAGQGSGATDATGNNGSPGSVVTSNAGSGNAGSQTTTASQSTFTSLPPGVRMDPNITPIAGLSDTSAQKFAAVLSVAQSKLGTPYIWGHNEDRGQYGFDCSNFVEYVFHHALGYLFSTSSRTQFYSVGTPVSLSQMRPGDLLFFSDNSNSTGTAHVGIYIGNGEMIQEGGGLGKVGYLSVTSGYWAHHLVAAHRLF